MLRITDAAYFSLIFGIHFIRCWVSPLDKVGINLNLAQGVERVMQTLLVQSLLNALLEQLLLLQLNQVSYSDSLFHSSNVTVACC